MSLESNASTELFLVEKKLSFEEVVNKLLLDAHNLLSSGSLIEYQLV